MILKILPNKTLASGEPTPLRSPSDYPNAPVLFRAVSDGLSQRNPAQCASIGALGPSDDVPAKAVPGAAAPWKKLRNMFSHAPPAIHAGKNCSQSLPNGDSEQMEPAGSFGPSLQAWVRGASTPLPLRPSRRRLPVRCSGLRLPRRSKGNFHEGIYS